MGFSETREHRDGDVKFVVHARTIDFFVYKEWLAETIRQRRVAKEFLWWSYEGWDREDAPLPVSATFQLDPDPSQPGPATTEFGPFGSPQNGPIGQREVKIFQVFAGISGNTDDGDVTGGNFGPNDLVVSRVNAMKLEYSFNREPQEMTIGANWVTKVIAVVTILALIALAAIFLL